MLGLSLCLLHEQFRDTNKNITVHHVKIRERGPTKDYTMQYTPMNARCLIAKAVRSIARDTGSFTTLFSAAETLSLRWSVSRVAEAGPLSPKCACPPHHLTNGGWCHGANDHSPSSIILPLRCHTILTKPHAIPSLLRPSHIALCAVRLWLECNLPDRRVLAILDKHVSVSQKVVQK